MSFLVAENLDESDQFILGPDFVQNFDVTIDLNERLIQLPDQKFRLKPKQAVVATFTMRNLNEFISDRQVRLVPNPNSSSSAI